MSDDDAGFVDAGVEDDVSTEQIEVLISALEHYSYCPRQCALIHVEQTYDENMHTMRGKLAHERVDSGDTTPNRGVETQRGIPRSGRSATDYAERRMR